MLLMSLPYLPPVSWCAALWPQQAVVLECCEHYQKGSLRNRCYIAGPNGMQRLSIPLEKGKNQRMPVREVRIASDEPWQRQHWRAIRTAYGNAPYFGHYADRIARYYERAYTFLFDFNLDLLQYVVQMEAGWKGEFILNDHWRPPGAWTEGADQRSDISLLPPDMPGGFKPQQYPQVFEDKFGFIPNLSVLDALFCCGKKTGDRITAGYR